MKRKYRKRAPCGDCGEIKKCEIRRAPPVLRPPMRIPGSLQIVGEFSYKRVDTIVETSIPQAFLRSNIQVSIFNGRISQYPAD